MNKRKIGADKEELAAQYLVRQGMELVERNFRCRMGEIDIIGRHGKYLVFVEVKYRGSRARGSALEAVNRQKQRQICKIADYYRCIHRLGANTMIRYDVVALQEDDIVWIRNAFAHSYR